jgi:hypothetical protein
MIGMVGLSAAKLGPASAATDTTALAQSNFFNILISSREATHHAQWRLVLAPNWALAATAVQTLTCQLLGGNGARPTGAPGEKSQIHG